MALLPTMLLLMVGFSMLTGGAKLICDSATHVARRLGIGSSVTGIFLVSIGTSAPDFVSVITALWEGHQDISIGNILGSNFANATLGFGIASLVMPFKCTKEIAKVEFPLLLALTVFFAIRCLRGGLSRLDGIVLMVAFASYAYLSFCGKGSKVLKLRQEPTAANFVDWPMGRSVLIFALSAALLAWGAHLVVMSCCKISDFFGLSKTFVGFSLLAFGTSAPEIFVVAIAARRGNHAICSGNIIGSSLINLMFVAGLCATVHPLYLGKNVFFIEAIVLIGATAMGWYVFWTKKVFSRMCGLIFIATYLAAMLLMKN
jgi:cation:H+ antiporter